MPFVDYRSSSVDIIGHYSRIEKTVKNKSGIARSHAFVDRQTADLIRSSFNIH